jgi:hypothetical protein
VVLELRSVSSVDETPSAPVSQEDPRQTVQIFIDLIQRHEQSFYYFVHKVQSKGEGLFSGLMQWTERFLDVVRNGIGDPISLEFILPHAGEERRIIMKEIDEVALYHYKLKVQHESKVRRRFGRAGDVGVAGEDPVAQDVVNGFMHDFSFGDLMKEDAMDMAAEEEESDGSDESSGEYESGTGDSETGSEESGRSPSPIARLRVSPSTLPVQDSSHRPAEQLFPSSPPLKPTFPPHTDSSAPPRTPSVASPGSSGSRIRKLSQSLRKSRSMTFGSTRPPLSNSAEAPPVPPPPVPPPPVPPLPLSVAQSRSTASLTGRSKPLPPLSRDASSSRQALPPLPHEAAPAHKRYPTAQKLPQTPTRPKKKQGASEALKPPELKKMSELLPIFVEMVRYRSLLREAVLTFDIDAV